MTSTQSRRRPHGIFAFFFQAALCMAALCLLGPGRAVVAAEPLRTWSDASGKFKIKAKFISEADGVITLEQEDGSELEIELKKLNAADQKYVADLKKAAADSPFKSKAKSKAEDPFKAKSKSKKPAAKKTSDEDAESEEPAGGEARMVPVNWSSAEQVALGSPSDEWKVEFSGEVEGFEAKPKNCPLPSKTSFFEKMKGLAISLVARKAAVGFVRQDPGVDQPITTRVVLCDLATGKTSPPASGPGDMVPLALHDDGLQILMRRNDFGIGKQDRLEIWTIKGTQFAKSIAWVPYDDASYGPNRDVTWAAFLSPDLLATASRGGKVAIWKFPEIEPLCTFMVADGSMPALSADRKRIAYCTGKEVGLFDVTKREVIAQQSIPEALTSPNLAFSPSGRRLACIAAETLMVWDVATGKLEKSIPMRGLSVQGGIEFPDDKFVLANGAYLIDIENQLKLWTYQGHDMVRCAAGWTFFGVPGDNRGGGGSLGAGQLPHPQAKAMLQKALTDPDLFVLKAGTTVKLNLDGIPDAAQRERIQQSLTQRLKTIDCQAGPNGTIELAASMEGPKDRELSFRRAGDYKMKEYVSRVKFVYQGQPAWEASATNFPVFMIHLKKGENIESHLRGLEKPNYDFFDRVELPKFVQKPTAGNAAGGSLTMGQSRVTATGIQ